jgi:hypothetical protein
MKDNNVMNGSDKNLTLQEVYTRIGGMGRFHYISFFLVTFGYISGTFLGGMLGFIEL